MSGKPTFKPYVGAGTLCLTFGHEDQVYIGEDGIYSDAKLLTILQRLLEPDGDLSVSAAAILITSMLPIIGETGPGRRCEEGIFCGSVLDVASQIPYQNPVHSRLAALMKMLSEYRHLNNAVTHMETGWYYDDYFYEFRKDFHTDFYFIPTGDENEMSETSARTPITLEERQRARTKDLNATSFAARLASNYFFSDLEAAIFSFENTIESASLAGVPASDSGCHASTAALWIIFAGQTILQRLVEGPKNYREWEKNAAREPTGLYIGPAPGLLRWKFWKKGLWAESEREAASAECRELTKRAVDLMEAIERSSTW